jgi:ABC-type transporter Mla subunit MlaD
MDNAEQEVIRSEQLTGGRCVGLTPSRPTEQQHPHSGSINLQRRRRVLQLHQAE